MVYNYFELQQFSPMEIAFQFTQQVRRRQISSPRKARWPIKLFYYEPVAILRIFGGL